MESRFRLLSSRSRTGAARQLTLEAAVAWSYELLHDTEKLVFASVSVFPSSFDLSAAESECSKAMDIDEFEVDDLVESLVDKSLLQAEQRPGALRYRMLETIAQYAADRLADLGTEVAERVTATHALHFLALAEEAAPHLEASDHAEWMTKLEADYDNVRMALSSLTASTEHGAEALRMVGFLRIFWRETGGGNLGESHDLAVAALAHPRGQSATRERSNALLTRATIEYHLGESAATQAASEEGLAIAKEIDDSPLAARHLCFIAMACCRAGEYGLAKEAAEEALVMARSVGDANILALAHVGMGAATGLEDLESARAHFVRALRLQKRAGNAGWVGVIHNNLANAELIAGNLEAARSNFQAGLAHSSSPYSRALSLVNLGTVCLLEGDDKSAKSCCCDALRLLVRAGVWGEIPYPLLNLAICASASEDFERSAVLHGAAAAMIEGHGISFEPAESALRERDIAALRGKMGDADYERSYARGYEMSRPDVIDVALS